MAAKTLLHEITGVIEAPPRRVAELILTVRPGPIGGGNAWVLGETAGTLSGGPHRFTASMAGHAMTIEVDERTLATQGGWWYRGEYTVDPHPDGTALRHRVYNVAQFMRWGVRPANRFFVGFADRQRQAFADLLHRIERELDSSARLV